MGRRKVKQHSSALVFSKKRSKGLTDALEDQRRSTRVFSPKERFDLAHIPCC